MKSTVVWLSLLSTFSSSLLGAETDWIWSEAERRAGVSASFDKEFSIAKPLDSAILRTCGESASLRIDLNDRPIARVGPYDQLLRRDIVEQLRTGEHRLTVQAASVEGPSAFFLRLDLSFVDEMFAAASCIKCHRIAGRGMLVGPDLTSVGSRFSRRDLLQSIIHPSQVVAEKYRSLQIITNDGKSYVGQPALGGDYRSSVLRLATNPAQPFEITEISKRIIEEQRPSTISWMPEGLLNTLTKNEILDLLAFLEARGEVPRE